MRILIVRLGAIGDVVHTLPALAALRRAMPEARIGWAVERGGSALLLKGNPFIDDLIELDMRGWRKTLTRIDTSKEILQTVKHLKEAEFDLSLDFQGLMKSAMIPWLARIPRRIGFAREALREPASSLMLTEQAPVNDEDHVIRKNLQLVERLGVPVTNDYEFPIYLEAQDIEFAESVSKKSERSFAIINPGGGWPTKLWSVEGFAEIADRLWQEYGIRPIITYGPGEEDLAGSVINNSRAGAAVMLDTTLKQFFALSQRAKLFIGGDTGPMHLAAAAGAPIVAIFGPTSACRNGPFAKVDVVIERFDLDCRVDCYRRSCSHTSCLKIPAETVWNGVVRRLKRGITEQTK